MKNTRDPGSQGATLVGPNKYSGEAVGLMCVCVMGNTQPACHRLNSSCCLQGHRESCWSWDHNIDLVRAVDHMFVEILGRIPQYLCGMLRLKPQTYYQT